MNKLSILALAAGLTLAATASMADTTVTGAWKLSVGVNDAPCVLTLAADSSASSTGDCNGTNVGRWKTSGASLQLLSGNGELVAWLNPKGDDYVGSRTSDGRKVELSR
jgi:hypothetical protein